jgi:hypothetical protein
MTQFISDRLILGDISRILKFQANFEYFLDIPASQLHLEFVRVVREDKDLGRLCYLMNQMDHPYVLYKDIEVTPWDVCLAQESEYVGEPPGVVHHHPTRCPHCGRNLD